MVKSTTTSPTVVGRAASALSVSSNQIPGPSKSVVSMVSTTSKNWKPRCDDDVPSDDSDPGDKHGAKQRTRTRKNIFHRPAAAHSQQPGGMSLWLGGATRKQDTGHIANASSKNANSNLTTSMDPSMNKVLFLPSSRPGSSHDQVSLTVKKPSSLHFASSSEGHARKLPRINEKDKQSDQTKEGQNLDQTSKRILPTVSKVTNIQSTGGGEFKEWKIYSVWFPAWDIIWKRDNCMVPLAENEQFYKLLNNILSDTSLPLNIQDINVLRVRTAKSCKKDDFKITGILEKRPDFKRKHIKWIPAPKIVRAFLKLVTTVGDIIVQYIPNSDKIITLHLTSKEESKTSSLPFGKVPGVSVSFQTINYKHYSPFLVICIPNNKEPAALIEQEDDSNALREEARMKNCQVVLERTEVHSKPNSPSSRSQQPPGNESGSSRIQENISRSGTSPEDNEGQGNTNVNDVDDEQNVHNDVNNAQSVGNLNNEVEVSDNPPIPSSIPSAASQDFNVADFIRQGKFALGPSRPKVKKTPGNDYVYNTLEELSEMLKNSIKEEKERGGVITMMLSGQKYLHALVDDVLPQQRHLNAQYLRVSDESMDSVLLRIHTPSDVLNSAVGPTIEVGNIIRIHRLTVQIEWDQDREENRMVLSTCSHVNYTIFEKSQEENKFFYHTCAKTITLGDIDLKRVGELYFFKSNRPTNRREEEVQTVQQCNIILDGDRDEQIDHLPISVVMNERGAPIPPMQTLDSSEGICSSDLLSPPHTVEGDVRSDESFFSATSQNSSPKVANDFLAPIPNREETDQYDAEDEEREATLRTKRFTYFKELTKTKDSVNLIVQIVSLFESTDGDVWHLLIKDTEQTLPSCDFQSSRLSAPDLTNFEDCLVLKITNGNFFEDGRVFHLIYNDQGSEEVYLIRNVKIKGDAPPFELEVDGRSLEMERHSYYPGLFAETFNTNSTEGINIIHHSLGVTHQRQHTAGNVNLQQQHMNVPLLPPLVTRIPNEESERSLEISNAAATNIGQGSEPTTRDSSSPSHSRTTRGLVPTATSRKRPHSRVVTNEEQWTGRLRQKRKPRNHYQSEDSFEC